VAEPNQSGCRFNASLRRPALNVKTPVGYNEKNLREGNLCDLLSYLTENRSYYSLKSI
jgi:hypothetical protein